MANMIPISTVTVGSGGSSSINFVGLSQSYNDLLIKINTRGTYGGVCVRFNGDSGANYTWRALLQVSGSPLSESQATYGAPYNSFIYVRASTSEGQTASAFGTADIYIPNYNSSNYKSASADSNPEANATLVNTTVITAGLWSNTAPINSVVLTSDSGTFSQYTTATLYGIRKY
jgi:hypothetical protein